jgi:hypothetical protein
MKSEEIQTIFRILKWRGIRRNRKHVLADLTFEPRFAVALAVLEHSVHVSGFAYGTAFCC